MNHWYLCWLDIWWAIRWAVPGLCGWALIEFLGHLFKSEPLKDEGDLSTVLLGAFILVAIICSIYYFSMKSLGAL